MPCDKIPPTIGMTPVPVSSMIGAVSKKVEGDPAHHQWIKSLSRDGDFNTKLHPELCLAYRIAASIDTVTEFLRGTTVVNNTELVTPCEGQLAWILQQKMHTGKPRGLESWCPLCICHR